MRDILAILLLQCVCGGLGALVALWRGGPAAAGVAIVGAAICVGPNGFLALRLLVTQDPRHMLRALWLGELGKLALTVVLFALALNYMSVVRERPFWVLAGFMAAQLGTFGGFLLPGNRRGT